MMINILRLLYIILILNRETEYSVTKNDGNLNVFSKIY